MSDSPYTNVEAVKRYLRMTPQQISGSSGANTVDDGLIQTFVDAIGPSVEQYCSRVFPLSTWQERRNGSGTSQLTLSNQPIVDVTRVELLAPRAVPTAADFSAPLVADVDYTFTQYSVVLFSQVFPRGMMNVRVTYQAGYAAMPADIERAATKWCAVRYREVERLGMRTKVLGSETIEFDLADMPPDVKGVLDRYSQRSPITNVRLERLSS